eukprot:3713743-Pleurochrysis_carterae.AAC.2
MDNVVASRSPVRAQDPCTFSDLRRWRGDRGRRALTRATTAALASPSPTPDARQTRMRDHGRSEREITSARSRCARDRLDLETLIYEMQCEQATENFKLSVRILEVQEIGRDGWRCSVKQAGYARSPST